MENCILSNMNWHMLYVVPKIVRYPLIEIKEKYTITIHKYTNRTKEIVFRTNCRSVIIVKIIVLYYHAPYNHKSTHTLIIRIKHNKEFPCFRQKYMSFISALSLFRKSNGTYNKLIKFYTKPVALFFSHFNAFIFGFWSTTRTEFQII